MVRIIAHFTNDEKREIALKIMPKGSVTQSGLWLVVPITFITKSVRPFR
jgi:hypothetical protein